MITKRAIILRRIRTKHVAIILALAALAGLLAFRVFQSVTSDAQPARGGQGARVQTVETSPASRGVMSEKITLTGALKAKDQVDVTPKVSGRVMQVLVDTGQSIGRGALIAVIEDAEIEQQVVRSQASIAVTNASIAQRQAELNKARAELNRHKQLLDAGLLSRQQFEEVQMRHQVAQAQLELAHAQRRQSQAEERELKIRQGHTRVYSPLSGAVAKRHVDVGAMVSSAVPIVTVVNLDTMVIQANASERDIARIKPGSAATVTFDSLPGQQYQGRVLRISPVLDPQTRNGVVEVEIDNRGGALKGEMFARVELDLGTTRETTLVPRDALVYRGDQPGVYLLESDTARYRAVETGLTQEDKVEVLNGLKQGEVVITRGANVIKDGDRVRVLDSPGSGGSQGP